MKRVGKEPKLLPRVMEAIASLRDRRGSSQKQITEHLIHLFKKSDSGIRNIPMQIKKALSHGLKTGLIRQKSGKFSLGLDKKDYAVFKRFRQIRSPSDFGIIEARRKKRRRRAKRKGRRRRSKPRRKRRRSDFSENESPFDGESGLSFSEDSEPADRSRGRKRKSRRRRGRRRTSKPPLNSDSSDTAKTESNTNVHSEKSIPEQEKNEHQNRVSPNHNGNSQSRNQSNEEDDQELDNHNCMCNMDEDDLPRCMSREGFYHDSYLN